MGVADRLSGRLEKLEKGINPLLAANGLAAPEEVKKAERLQAQRAGPVVVEKKKAAEVEKVRKLE